MDFLTFKESLSQHSSLPLTFRFDSGKTLPPHFHITEVGKVSKDFVDCGGIRRSTTACVLQTLVANDVEHRLTAGKLAAILEHASVLGLDPEVPVEAEVQTDTIGVFAVSSVAVHEDQLIFQLESKHTACLAPDSCGLEILTPDDGSCCGDTGCC